ncbi:MAG TPA: hypothetical protein VFE90_01780 [Myxococcales bacterium]|nr:hypothetical protein [Myxococcales bacterium]
MKARSVSLQLLPIVVVAALSIGCGGGMTQAPGNPGDPGGPGSDGGTGGLSVAPQRAFIAAGGTQSFTCSTATCTWTVREGTSGGAIATTGVYTAPKSGGTYHVIATNGGATAEAAVAVSGPAAAVNVSPASIYLAPGGHYTFKSAVSGPTDTSVTWSVSEGASGGAVAAGAYTAPSTAGTYHVVATSVANPVMNGSATVIVSATPVVVVSLDPHTTSLKPADTSTFTATVTGTADTAVTWSVVEATGGSVNAGVYTAPGGGGTYHVVATSHADASKSDMAIASVAPFNSWYDVTGVVDATGFSGATFVLVDPVRPSDFYAFASEKGVYKSVDFGQTWAKISVSDTSNVASGRPWAAAIDPDPARDPNKAPVIYAAAGFGANGLFKSTDGGAHWVQLFTPHVYYCYQGLADVYGMAIEPGNNQHILVSIKQNWCTGQADTGILESFDAGATWTEHTPPAGFGQGHYIYFIDSNTWLVNSIAFGATGGTFRTTTAGRKNGVPDPTAWTKVLDAYHTHGGAQSFVDPQNGVIYSPSVGGMWRSEDHGATWAKVYGQDMSSVFATPNYLYGTNYYLNGTASVYYVRSPRGDGKTWTQYTNPTGMGGWGPFWGGVSYDGSHWVMVTPNNNSGLWRYIEALP